MHFMCAVQIQLWKSNSILFTYGTYVNKLPLLHSPICAASGSSDAGHKDSTISI